MASNSIHNKESWANRLIRLEDHYASPEALITRAGCPVVVRGELTLLSGAQKTYKTHIHQAITAAVLRENDTQMFASTKRNLNILILDTEQRSASLQQQYSLLLKSIGLPEDKTPGQLNMYCLRGLSLVDMHDCLTGSIELHKPDIVVVDNVADLVEDINDYQACDRLVKQLMNVADQHECAVVAVIHQNPGTNKERGHLGTILANKTSGYVSLAKSGNQVCVSSTGKCRGAEFPDFLVTFDPESGTVVEVPGGGPSLPTYAAAQSPKPKKLDQYVNAIPAYFGNNPFGDPEPLTTGEIVERLMKEFAIPKENRNVASRAIKKACEAGLIVKTRRGEYERKVEVASEDENE